MKFLKTCLIILRGVVLGFLILVAVNYLIYLANWGNVQ